MNQFPFKQVKPCILDLIPYQPGKPVSECKRELGLQHFIKLASNENPYGTSPLVKQALQSALAHISDYPDANGYALRKILAERAGLAMDQVILGNGSEELLRLTIDTFVMPDDEVMIGECSFMGYEMLAKAAGAALVKVPMPTWQLDLDVFTQLVSHKTKMIILANPNNPTGTYFNEAAFLKFMQQVPAHVLVICDEAYYEYMQHADYPQTHCLLSEFRNLIIMRTFSKGYGLAGMRVGYAFAHEDLIALVNRLRQPFNVNSLAQTAALAALEDQAFLNTAIKANHQVRSKFCRGLDALGIQYIPSETNFVMFKASMDGTQLYTSLLQRGIIIRPLKPYYALQNYVRASIGLEPDMQFLLDQLKDILQIEVPATNFTE